MDAVPGTPEAVKPRDCFGIEEMPWRHTVSAFPLQSG